MKKRVIVTGGAGFIGSQLAEELVRLGYHVTILDNLSTGRMDNIEGLLKNNNFVFIQGSVTDLPLLEKVFKGVHFVFHQAAITSVPQSIENPLAYHEANMTGSLNVLLAARNNNIKKVIYASSASVYGDLPSLPNTEDMPPNPCSPYAVTKLAGEYYCQVFQKVCGLPTICLRYFNVYGPKQDPDSPYASVIPLFIKHLSEGRAPIIYGDGNQTRDFIFVKDATKANIVAAESDATGIFNIGSGKSVTINDMAHLITKLVGSNLKPVHQQQRPADIRHSLADISKARAIGFELQYTLEDGLRETHRSLQHAT